MDAPWQVSIINNNSLYLKEIKQPPYPFLLKHHIHTLLFSYQGSCSGPKEQELTLISFRMWVCPKQYLWAALTTGSCKQKLKPCFLNANHHTILWTTNSITAAGKQGLPVRFTLKSMFIHLRVCSGYSIFNIYIMLISHLLFCHICSKASASSTFVISSESWNFRKPFPPWPDIKIRS